MEKFQMKGMKKLLEITEYLITTRRSLEGRGLLE